MADLPREFRSQAYLQTDEIIDYLHGEMAAFCKSPIEVAFGVAFVLVCKHLVGETFFREWEPDDLGLLPIVKRVIEAQVPVGPYTADFVVSAWPRDERVKIIVECDGHDFHEKTKEQAQHDKARDRALQAAGYRVLRYTGSEIYRDAFRCANETNKLISTLSAGLT
jgi:very-short-patch-repair endonuclease